MNDATAAPAAVAVAGVRVAFGSTAVLRGLDLVVPWGQRVALLGSNGTGKSTLLRTIATLHRPTAGSITLAGADALADPVAVRPLLGVVAHQTYLYDELTALENLRYYAALYDLPQARSLATARLAEVGLAGQANLRAGSLSRGQQQRLTLARALLHNPPLLLLDEPDTGLDLAAFQLLETLLLATERTVLLATHNFRQAARLCQRAVILHQGRVAADLALTGGEQQLETVYRQVTGVSQA